MIYFSQHVNQFQNSSIKIPSGPNVTQMVAQWTVFFLNILYTFLPLQLISSLNHWNLVAEGEFRAIKQIRACHKI